MDELPGNLSALDHEELLEERAARDEKLRPLFRRWPSLSNTEMKELRRVYAERLRIARWLGRRRHGEASGVVDDTAEADVRIARR
jgi:hypothetical protein